MSGSLDHSPADILRYLLIDLGLGTLPSSAGVWPVYATKEPDSPDSCITVYDTEGTRDGRTMANGEVQQHYGAQVRVRAPTHALGHAKANAVAEALDKQVWLDTVTIGSSVYMVYAVSRRSGPFSLGEESPTSKRVIFTLNVTIAVRQTN